MIDELLTIKGQKEIVKEIIDKFKRNNNMSELQYYPVTTTEYMLDNLTTRKFAIQKKIKDAYQFAKDGTGFSIPSHNILVIFLHGKDIVIPHKCIPVYGVDNSNINIINKRDSDYDKVLQNNNYYDSDKYISIVSFIKCIYHELGHIEQKNLNDPYTNLISNIETVIKKYNYNHYKEYHDSYYSEIDADIRSMNNTIEFVKEYPELNNLTTSYINNKKNNATWRLYNYNFDEFFTKFYLILNNNKDKIKKSDIVKKEWFKIFFTPDLEFKNIDYILSYLRNNRFDSKIIYSILTSTPFVSSIDYNEICDTSKEYIKKIINYKIKENEKKYKLTSSTKFMDNNSILSTYLERIDNNSSIKTI